MAVADDTSASLSFYTSLQGEAELEMENVDMKRIHAKDGVEFILNRLRSAFKHKTVYVKRHLLHENVARYSNESLRTYINRYKRTEGSLRAVGVDVTLTYDSESRGSRLLDRSKLSYDQQRLVLVSTNQSLDFEMVASALTMHFPEYRAPPPLFQPYKERPSPKRAGKQNFGT